MKKAKEEGSDLLHILYRTGQEALFAHIGNAQHAREAQAMIIL